MTVSAKRSKRIEKLRKRILEDAVPTVCLERATLITEIYRENQVDSIIFKRAKALAKILREMTLFINEDDLLAGNQASMLRSAPVYPENFVGWMKDEEKMEEINNRMQNPLKIPEEIRQELKKIASYWEDKTLYERCYHVFSQSIKDARQTLCFSISHEKNALGHCIPDYSMVLEKGYTGIKADIYRKIDSLNINDTDYFEKKEFLEACIIICDAIVACSNRYAELAKELAEKEEDVKRKTELEKISQICAKVPAYPADSFYEALQSVYFSHLVSFIETNAYSISFGRFDQYMYPYYKKDIDASLITREEAQELLNCFWVKTNEIYHVDDSETVTFHGGHPFGQHLTVGGINTEGSDATNELSFMCLEAHATVEMFQPDFSVRIHALSPYEFLKRSAEVIKKGLGLPHLFNDDVIIPSLLNRGLPLAEARNYTPTGCVEISTEKCWTRANGGWFNLPKMLEFTLNEGKCLLSGKQISFSSKPAEQIKTFEEFMEIFREHLKQLVKLHVEWSNLIDKVHEELMPEPSVSLLIHDCLDKAKDVTGGGARYNFTSPLMVGIATVADSLAAIKKVVFEDKEISLEQLRKALEYNYNGHEAIQATLDNCPHKYGNDDDYVDALARQVTSMFCDEFEKYKNPRGGDYQTGFWSIVSNITLGSGTAATPDGRRAKDPLSDSVSPNNGKDVNGITASLKSAAKLDQWRASNGTVFNRHISPAELEGEDRVNSFVSLIKSYFDLGGTNLAFNVVSAETLKEAQKHPEKYSDLLVKVAGYAAFFNELGKAAQDDLIKRTEHGLG